MTFRILVELQKFDNNIYLPSDIVYPDKLKRELDLFDDIPIDTTYQISDISDITSVNSSYTKTITLPATPKNNKIFSFIFQIEIDKNVASDYYFNPKRKTKCWMINESNVQFNGYLQLTKVNINKESHITSYEAVIYGETDNVFSTFGDGLITDVTSPEFVFATQSSNYDFNDLNHIYNAQSITASWDDVDSGLKPYYPMIDYGNGWDYNFVNNGTVSNGLGTEDLYPAIPVKVLWDKIFQSTADFTSDGLMYQYVSQFLESELVKRLYIPASGGKMQRRASGVGFDGIDKRPTFKVGGTFSSYTSYYLSTQFFNQYAVMDTLFNQPNNTQFQAPYYDYGYTYSINGDPYFNWPVDNCYKNLYMETEPNTGATTSTFKQRFHFDFKIGTQLTSKDAILQQDQDSTTDFPSHPGHHTGYAVAPSTLTIDKFGIKIWVVFYRQNDPNTGLEHPAWASGLGEPIPNENGEIRHIINNDPLYLSGDMDWIGFINGYGPYGVDLTNAERNVDVNEGSWCAPNLFHSSPSHIPAPSLAANPLAYTYAPELAGDFYTGRCTTAFLDGRYSNNPLISYAPLMSGEKVRARVFTATCNDWYNNICTEGVLGQVWFPPQRAYVIYDDPEDHIFPAGTWNATQASNITTTQTFGYGKGTSLYNEVSLDVIKGMIIDYSQILPKNIKKKDFILTIIKMFNLYVEPFKNNEKQLLIEPRDVYYTLGQKKDWTKKVDMSQDIEIDILAEKQNKSNVLAWKDDKDYYNTLYKNSIGDGYGNYTYYINNEFLKGEKKLDPVIFSATPLVELYGSNRVSDYSEFIIPVIAKEFNTANPIPTGAVEDNIRILIRPKSGKQPLTANTWKFEGATYNYYPYLGHIDDPSPLSTPAFDLNFGQPLQLFYNTPAYTANNLVGVYHARTLDEVADVNSRLLVVNMYLSPKDIYNFSFSDLIFLQTGVGGGQYYKVNKISGYEPSKKVTCKVELLKTLAVETRLPAIGVGNVNNTVLDASLIAAQAQLAPLFVAPAPLNVIATYFNNNIQANAVIANGNYNNIQSPALVNGNFNLINQTIQNAIVSGDFNFLGNNILNALILGNNNVITANIENAVAIGNNLTVRNSNSITTNSKIIQQSDLISAGRNEVLNEFPDISTVNFVSGGRNKVRGLGSVSPVTIISGGRNE
ncbi:MAG: hypothetical protein BGO69_15850 [Bacteroidetes bacterium 46-16]|nr:MAG: hypothetical protein BGO69_15850 [Bacteroidetes bacterium 46-16]